ARNLPGGGVPPHIDHREDEAFYVLDGRYEFRIGDQVRICEAGEFAFVPMGTPQAFTNVGADLGRLLVVVSPAGILEAYFAEIGEPIADLAHPPAPPTTPRTWRRSWRRPASTGSRCCRHRDRRKRVVAGLAEGIGTVAIL